jgi:hypothetical protein
MEFIAHQQKRLLLSMGDAKQQNFAAEECLTSLDLLKIGRSSVDLYGAQVGGRLEDRASFQQIHWRVPNQYCSRRGAIGLEINRDHADGRRAYGPLHPRTAGPRGRGCSGGKTDPERLTALVLLGIRDQHQFPLIFYRKNRADMALCEDDINPAFTLVITDNRRRRLLVGSRHARSFAATRSEAGARRLRHRAQGKTLT